MKIIIAPAKKMIIDQDAFPALTEPIYLDQTQQLLAQLQHLTYPCLLYTSDAADEL